MLGKRRFLVLLLMSIVIFGISVISLSKEITLEFQQWWEPELPEGVLREICDEFTAKTGINVELISNPYADTKVQIAAGAATGMMPDVVGLDGSWVYDFAKQGAIANLSELMVSSGYDDSQLSLQVQVEGNTYMIAVVNFAYSMYVNKDILKNAGIVEFPTTWSEFKSVAQKVTDPTSNIYAYALPLSSALPNGIQNQFMSWLWASGGNMLENGKPQLIGNEKLVQTTELIKWLFDEGLVTPGAYIMREPDMVQEFVNGRLAFMISSLAHLTLIKEGAPNMDVAITSIPKMDGYSGKSGICVANWGIGIASNSKHKEEAWRFIEYLMSPEVNAKLAVYANAFPGNTASEPDYSDQDKLFLDAYEIYQESYAINEFTGLPRSEDLMRSFLENFVLYLNEEIDSAETMLETIQKEWLKIF